MLKSVRSQPDKFSSGDSARIKVLKYISMIIRNMEKLDDIKSKLFHNIFSCQEVFLLIDLNKKGFLEEEDLV